MLSKKICDSVLQLIDVLWFLAGCLGQTGLTGLWYRSDRSASDRVMIPSWVEVYYLLICITCRIFVGTHILLHPHGCWDLGGVLFFFNLCKLACEAKCIEFHSLAQIKGELKLNLRIQKHYWISFESFNRLSSITKKGEIERTFRPLVGFGVLIDNTIKGLTCLCEIMSRYLICEMI